MCWTCFLSSILLINAKGIERIPFQRGNSQKYEVEDAILVMVDMVPVLTNTE